MFSRLCLFGVMFFALSSAAHSADKIPGWTFLIDTSGFNFYGKDHSFKESNGLRSILIQQLPSVRTSTDAVLFRKFAVSAQACRDEYGEILIYDLGGKLVNKFDYVKGGSSAAAYIADVICMG